MKEKCKICELPMFHYAIKHNGKDEMVYRCMVNHGTVDINGNVKIRRGQPAKGVTKHFKGLFKGKI